MRIGTLDLPLWALRCLHSEWIGYTLRLDEVVRDAHITRAQGITFESFLLSVAVERYRVACLQVDGDMHIALTLPVEGDADAPLFTLPARRMGIDLDYLVAGAALDLDDELIDLLESQ